MWKLLLALEKRMLVLEILGRAVGAVVNVR